jgi:4-amino-4-deoxy-L-arabinose transferase-like glycosyltransferase
MQLSAATGPVLVSLGVLLVHLATNHQYGFHRDELGVLEDSRYLEWGYVSYPPVGPFLARVASDVFGVTPAGIRVLPAMAQTMAVLLSGLIAREFGGGRWAQTVAATAVAIAPFSVLMGGLFQYVSFEYAILVALVYCLVRMLNSGEHRWWVVIGALLGLGLMTKYTMVVWAFSLVAGLCLTSARRHLRAPWLLAGVLLALVIVLPNLVWQAQHGFIAIDFTRSIHDRDVGLGRTQAYLPEQLFVCVSVMTFPLWFLGLWFLLQSRAGARFRPLGLLYVVSLVVFLASQGRGYYVAPGYPVLLAAGTVALEATVGRWRTWPQRVVKSITWVLIAVGLVGSAALTLPIAPIGSAWWSGVAKVHDNFSEQIGWPELVTQTADIYHSIPDEDRLGTMILVANYGEVGALNLYGPDLGLPRAVSGVNSAWYRGLDSPEPRRLIVLGYRLEAALTFFETCDLAGRFTLPFAVVNEESRDHPEIFMCHGLRRPWPQTWAALRHFG